jgi:DNA-directed RNA polymerase subunit omega
MAERRATLMEPRMEQLLDRVGSKFTLVTLAAKRAREINDYYNQLGEGLGKIVPPQVTSVSRKPLSISLEEIEAAKIKWVKVEEVAEVGADDDEAADLVAVEGEAEAGAAAGADEAPAE